MDPIMEAHFREELGQHRPHWRAEESEALHERHSSLAF